MKIQLKINAFTTINLIKKNNNEGKKIEETS
jgi:hypothetical protein